MARWGMPAQPFVLEKAAKERAAKVAAKGKPVDMQQLIRMEPNAGNTNVRQTKCWTRWLGMESRCLEPFNSFSEFNKDAGEDRGPGQRSSTCGRHDTRRGWRRCPSSQRDRYAAFFRGFRTRFGLGFFADRRALSFRRAVMAFLIAFRSPSCTTAACFLRKSLQVSRIIVISFSRRAFE